MKRNYLAFDFGAESGRAIIGTIENNRVELKEIHRFPTGNMNIGGKFYWNIYRLFEEIKKGLSICANEYKIVPESIAIDTWGVDFALVSDNTICGIPFAYRDARTNTAMQEVFAKIPKEKVYELTGIQFMQFNSIFQLHAYKRDNSPFLKIAEKLLFVPDIFNFLLSGELKSEFSFATTSQLFNPRTNAWEKQLFDAIGVDTKIMCEVVPSGTVIGKLRPEVAEEAGLPQVAVTAVASHDTGSAIVAIPALDSNFAYISSGTWSLMGIELDKPLINEQTLKYNFTNEGGACSTYRFLKNIMGLWVLQQSRKAWAKQKEYSYSELVVMASEAKPFAAFVNPDHSSFLNPADMVVAISEFCTNTNQTVPASVGEFARSIMEGLAFRYRMVLDELREVSDKKIERIHIIGGGTQNKLLCQFTANATGLHVVAGPAEGTAAGNIMVQGLADGTFKSMNEMRQVILNSFEIEKYEPQNVMEWNEAYLKFKTYCA